MARKDAARPRQGTLTLLRVEADQHGLHDGDNVVLTVECPGKGALRFRHVVRVVDIETQEET